MAMHYFFLSFLIGSHFVLKTLRNMTHCPCLVEQLKGDYAMTEDEG